MNVLIAIDSFKGSLSSFDAGKAVAQGVKRVYTDAVTTVVPVADGGEGTVEAMVHGTGAIREVVRVRGPLGEYTDSTYAVLKNGTVVMEMASAAGLTLIPPERRNPLYTSSCGVGEMIADAIDKGYRNFIIGIGGSATNDGGIGMLQSLGFDFADAQGNAVSPCAAGLRDLVRIATDHVNPHLAQCSFHVACDVTNPLCGENGCSLVYGPQKGADLSLIREMDSWMSHYAETVKAVFPSADPSFPGAGAAGGLGFALKTFLGAKLEAGIELLLGEIGFDALAREADVIITGEGRMDRQTAMGKAPAGIAAIAKKYGKAVIAFCGSMSEDIGDCHRVGIDVIFPIVRGAVSLESAMETTTAKRNLMSTTEQVFRLLRMRETVL